MLMRDTPYSPTTPGERRVRGLASAVLRAASRVLDGLASRLALSDADSGAEPVLEYHADAGAPEGALYVDGRLVGHVLGVTRL